MGSPASEGTITFVVFTAARACARHAGSVAAGAASASATSNATIGCNLHSATVHRADLDADPLVQFHRWLEDARSAGIELAEAMALATVNARGEPSARMVLLKNADEGGLTFYSGYESRK